MAPHIHQRLAHHHFFFGRLRLPLVILRARALVALALAFLVRRGGLVAGKRLVVGNRAVVVLADLVFAVEALDRDYLIKTQLCHFQSRALDLLNAW